MYSLHTAVGHLISPHDDGIVVRRSGRWRGHHGGTDPFRRETELPPSPALLPSAGFGVAGRWKNG